MTRSERKAGSSSAQRNKKKHVIEIKEEEVELINISSDEEEPEVILDGKEWSKEVTAAIQNWRKPQTLHVPAWAVRAGIYDKTRVMLESMDTGLVYRCSVISLVERGLFVRYLGDGWYTYLEDIKPKIGDKLNFELSERGNHLTVKLIRRQYR